MEAFLMEVSPRLRKDLVRKSNGMTKCTQFILRISVRFINIPNRVMRNILHQYPESFHSIRSYDVFVTGLFVPGLFQYFAAPPVYASYGSFRLEARLAGDWIRNPWIYF